MYCESVNEMVILPELVAARPADVDRRALPGLNVVETSQGLVITAIEECRKAGPGPSSSHTIGLMRITCELYQRTTRLPVSLVLC